MYLSWACLSFCFTKCFASRKAHLSVGRLSLLYLSYKLTHFNKIQLVAASRGLHINCPIKRVYIYCTWRSKDIPALFCYTCNASPRDVFTGFLPARLAWRNFRNSGFIRTAINTYAHNETINKTQLWCLQQPEKLNKCDSESIKLRHVDTILTMIFA